MNRWKEIIKIRAEINETENEITMPLANKIVSYTHKQD
jgi:hypothetical protein